MCTILDPRFKTHPFPNAITINEAKHALYEAAANVHPEEEETVAYEVKGSLFDDLDRAVCISKGMNKGKKKLLQGMKLTTI